MALISMRAADGFPLDPWPVACAFLAQ